MTSICPDSESCAERPRSGRHIVDVHSDRCWHTDDANRVAHRRYFLDIGEAVSGWGRYHGDTSKTGTAIRIVQSMATNHGGLNEIYVPTDNNNYVAVRFHADSKVGVYVGESHVASIDPAPDDRFTAEIDGSGYHRLYWPGYAVGTTSQGGSTAPRPLCACHVPVTADGTCTFDICNGVIA